MSLSDSSFWKEAVNSEIDSILSNHTWELVDLPPGNKPLGSKWIFKRKMKVYGTIDKYKARLVVKGFKQKECLDYFDTYSSVTRITSIRMLIALATIYDLEIHQMDVETVFLNGELEKELYMEQLEELNGPAARLVKSGEVKYIHFIFKLDFADWELMKKAVPEGEELMPNRDITTGPVFTEASIPNSDISANPVLNEAYKLVPVDDSQLRLRVTRVKKLSRKHGKVLREVSDVDNSPETGSPKFAMGA
ncbi:hypothetical protein BC332_30828 [Capsicum chinense]|nr:hypothetical protein BC332_30828 [Capsicum chinense]